LNRERRAAGISYGLSRNFPNDYNKPRSFLPFEREPVENRYAIGLSPQADQARISKGRVLDFEQRFSVKDDLGQVPDKFGSEPVPSVGRDRHIDAVASLATDDFK
jgi:hypothetical protein